MGVLLLGSASDTDMVLPLLGGAVGCGPSTLSHPTCLITVVHVLSLTGSREMWVTAHNQKKAQLKSEHPLWYATYSATS